MNNGAFGENFPYSNFHDLNMDWIIKIAKDFLDQYTHIQEIIANGEQSLQDLTTSGLEQLQEKADALEALLQQWYDTHSQDIANQLADALEDLNQWYTEHEGYLNQYVQDSITNFYKAADQKTQQSIQSIPSDYTQLSNAVTEMEKAFKTPYIPIATLTDNGYSDSKTYTLPNSTTQQVIRITNNSSDLGYAGFTYKVNGETVRPYTYSVASMNSIVINVPMPINSTDIRTITTTNTNGRNLTFEIMYDPASIDSNTSHLYINPVLRNGTVGNSTNVYGVATDDIYAFNNTNRVAFVINKPLKATTNYYVIYITTYSISSGKTDVASQAYRIKQDVIISNGNIGYYVNHDPNTLGFAIHIVEYNANNELDSIRAHDFIDGMFNIIQMTENSSTDYASFRDGTVGNDTNVNAVAFRQIMPFYNSKSVTLKINRPIPTGHTYRTQLTTYSIAEGTTTIPNQQYRVTSDKWLPDGDTVTFSNADGSVGFALAIWETDGTNWIPLRANTFPSVYVKITRNTNADSGNTIYVGPNETYTAFSEGLNRAVSLGNCKLVVRPGTYDLVTELGESGMLATPDSKGLRIGNGVEVYFEAGAKLKCNYTGSNTTLQNTFSVLMTMSSDFKLINADIECSNIRYCVHDEADGLGTFTHEYLNCIMYIDNTNTEWGPHQCIGGGLGQYSTIIIDGGRYESVGIDTYDNLVISYHNPATWTGTTIFLNKLIVKDVYIPIGKIQALTMGDSTLESIFMICGCSMTRDVSPDSTATGHFKTTAWNNTIRN